MKIDDIPKDMMDLYDKATRWCLSLKVFDKNLLCKGLQIDDKKCDDLLSLLKKMGVIDYQDDRGRFHINKNYNHSDYLLEIELIDDNKNKRIEYKKNKNKEVKKNISLFLAIFAVIFFCASVYFGFREPMSLLIIVPLCLLVVSLIEKIGAISALIGVIVICVFSLLWVNSITPIWGDRYDEKLKYEELKEKADEAERDSYRQVIQAESLVKQTLKDPSSADFRNSRKLNNGAVCGQVNAKNSFGAYTGFRNFIQKDSIVLVDDGSSDFDKYWNIYCN
ncbi:hypothetical protein ACK4Q7_06070 [Proteus mirabilis]|uniref:hypothetical protein n=1 Tax=Proteus mirabilis TaxID=584 RepID=UPI00391944B1